MRRTTLHRCTWIALLAFWAGLCMPVLAQIGSASGRISVPPDWCMPGGLPSGAVFGADDDARPGSDDPLPRLLQPACAYCVLQAVTAPLPPAAAPTWPLRLERLPGHALPAAAAPLPPANAQARCAAPPRAPPLHG